MPSHISLERHPALDQIKGALNSLPLNLLPDRLRHFGRDDGDELSRQLVRVGGHDARRQLQERRRSMGIADICHRRATRLQLPIDGGTPRCFEGRLAEDLTGLDIKGRRRMLKMVGAEIHSCPRSLIELQIRLAAGLRDQGSFRISLLSPAERVA